MAVGDDVEAILFERRVGEGENRRIGFVRVVVALNLRYTRVFIGW